MIGVLAVDDGPRAALAPLLAVPGFIELEPGAELHRLRALVCGTSDSPRGRELEAAARRAASAAGLPVVAIEDYPGNYRHVDGARTALLVVESGPAAELQRRRPGTCPPLQVCAAPRFDGLRRAARGLREAYARRDRSLRRVLWIGQPETEDAFAALGCVAPVLRGLRAELLFRAHPRDAGYAAGRYDALEMRDVTSLSLADCLALNPDLLVTQFSSVATEAGFHGIPTLHVLLPERGARTLMARKGYAVPLSCAAGAGFLADRADAVPRETKRALRDEPARAAVLAAFDRYYQTPAEALSGLLAHLYNQGITKE